MADSRISHGRVTQWEPAYTAQHRGLPTVCAAHGVSADTWDAFIKEVNTCLEECRSSVGWVPGVSAFMSMFTQPKAKHAIATCKSIVDKYNEAHFHQAGLKVGVRRRETRARPQSSAPYLAFAPARDVCLTCRHPRRLLSILR